jgi:hemerythrin-like metal-binding protein
MLARPDPQEGCMVSKDIAQGIESLDTEHQELADLFDRFERCIKTDVPLNELQAVVEEAIAKANAHFEHEEALIAASHYPKADEHKFLHRRMRTEFTTLVGGALNFNAHDPVSLRQLETMRAMLVEHIQGPDRELSIYLKAAGLH